MKKLSVTISSALILTLILTVFVFNTEAETNFSDVSDRYEAAVDHLTTQQYARGISSTQFGTNNEILRIDAAVMVANILGFNSDSESPDAGFTDVPGNRAWAVNALHHAGIINGKTAASYGSYDTMTRSEMAKVVALAYELTAVSETIPFTDVNPKFRSYVAALVEAKVTEGIKATEFGAYDNVTRGQFALFIHRADQLSVDKTPPEVISVD